MYIELHLLQNFAPACLNRDDTNSPKDCIFGGVRRARISSQCIKRAIREHTRLHTPELAGKLGTRTKRLHQQLVKRLVALGRGTEESAEAAL
ncbi:MAG: type I-E CRISPR-associated protein Cas7/Cse4/CasC, partial [Candidatus Competibacteraceae bacterium]|nr:type I-E CRISPR-associated protein Cas7/Cse4/CasC [Candidatus Competibacteraceae bacterium]